MQLVWYFDRAIGLVSYAALYLAVLTGILYNAESFGVLQRAARRVHVEVSVFAVMLMLGHGVLGVVDTWLVASGQAPVPSYGVAYLLGGVAVGAGALFVLLVAVLGFVDARRFERPWSPTVVHAFAYAGFGFATVHAAAVGTDVMGLVRPGLLAGGAFLVYVVLLRSLQRRGQLGGTGEEESAA
jgi:hypothetical protein